MHYSLAQLDTMLDKGLMVYEHYYPQATGRPLDGLNDKMISPFMRDGNLEEDPSFSIFMHRNKGTVFFKDHGIDRFGTHWQFVMDLYGIDFKTAVQKVKQELLGISENHQVVPTRPITATFVRPIKRSTRAEINPVLREWEETDLDYFRKAKISKSTLDIFHCSPLSHFELKKENKTIQILCKDHTTGYCYSFPSGHHKICQPFGEPAYKWTSNLDAEMDIFGFDLVPKECEHLFLIGGNRDCMSFFENIGHPVIALASESANISDEVHSIIKRIAKNTWTLYDNDKQGYRKAEKFEEEYGIPPLNFLYENQKVNDFTQLVEEKGEQGLKDFTLFLNKSINN